MYILNPLGSEAPDSYRDKLLNSEASKPSIHCLA